MPDLRVTFESRLAENYGELSDALRQAADFLAENPVDAATRPLRTVSRDSGVSPAAFSRLSRALGYADFEELREEMRLKIGARVHNLADRAGQLQKDHRDGTLNFLDAHLDACRRNLDVFGEGVDRAALDRAVGHLANARRVLLLGALGSTGVVEYMSYMANFCADNWFMAGRMGASLGSGLTGLDPRDVVLIVTKPPFAERSIRAAELARNSGAKVIVITDTHKCPALKFASEGFIVPTDSPHFYSSYVTTLFLVETLIGLIVSRAGDAARNRVADVEGANRILAEVWDP